jgi:hypothetical protein
MGVLEQLVGQGQIRLPGNKTVAINGTVLPGIANIPASFGVQNAQHINEFKAGLNWRFAPNYW